MDDQIEPVKWKAEYRRLRRAEPLPVKIERLVMLQHLYVQIVGRRRKLLPHERPWDTKR